MIPVRYIVIVSKVIGSLMTSLTAVRSLVFTMNEASVDHDHLFSVVLQLLPLNGVNTLQLHKIDA